MLDRQITILGYSEAAMYLRDASPDAIVSIHGKREFGVIAKPKHRLDLEFDDVALPDYSDVVAAWMDDRRRRWNEQNGRVETSPTEADVSALIHFAEATANDARSVLFHCGAGISRAPAAAMICLATWGGPGSEDACVAAVRRVRPAAVPHVGLIRMADRLLNRNGALLEALKAK